MPIDLSLAGPRSPYPAKSQRPLHWFLIWLLCAAGGAGLTFVLWPAAPHTNGLWYWVCMLGLPTLAFLILLGLARAGYEARYQHAMHWNAHRQAWLRARVQAAQRPLHIFGAAYDLPGGRIDLGALVAQTPTRLTTQALRSGSGLVPHNRYGDDDPIARPSRPDPPMEAPTLLDIEDADAGDDVPGHPLASSESVVRLIVRTLSPLVTSLHALSCRGDAHAPIVRVPVPGHSPGEDDARVENVRGAIRLAGLSDLECTSIPSRDGIIAADAWLDEQEVRPILIVAVEWHDAAPPNSTEGCVAVLLGANATCLPASVPVVGMLHRPASGQMDALASVIGNALLWGNGEPHAFDAAWVSSQPDRDEAAWQAAQSLPSVSSLFKRRSLHQPDRVLGNAGTMSGWLSIAALIEARNAATHLILLRGTDAQAAVVRMAPLTCFHAET